MVNLFLSGAVMNIDTRMVMLLLLASQLRTILAENYSGAIGTAVEANSGRYASTRDIGADYLKGHTSVGSNDVGHHQQEYQTDYGSSQERYGSNDDSGGSDEQQSHISAGYHHPQPATGSAYEVVHHQSGIDHQFVENNFSHQYEQESGGGTATGGGDGYHSTSEYEGPSSDYHQSGDGGFSSSQHQHTDVINYVPYPVVKKLHVPYSKAVHIPISHAVVIPVRKPVPIHIPIAKQVQVPVEKELKIPVERLVPYPVERPVPVPVEKRVPYTVVRYMPVKVAKPYAVKVPVVRTVVHKIKQFWL